MPIAPSDTLPESNLRTVAQRLFALKKLLDLLEPVPEEWVKTPASRPSRPGLALTPCCSYRELINSWRKALRWTEGLDHALATMLAAVASTKAIGDQLWIKVIGPAACGKSTLCEALSVNTEYVLAKSTIRGFHSGFKMEGGGDDGDVSLISQLRGKTLVTKDGDTLLQSPNLGQILSEARDLYDSVSRTHYRNAISRDYEGVRMTWILAGTSSLRSIDSSELGERFLDCVIMEQIDYDLEEEILWRVVNRAERNLAIEANGKAETQYEPELAKAMSLTGGYIDHLRQNAAKGLEAIDTPTSAKRAIVQMGLLVAYLRARPSEHQEENAEREFGARLVSQHVRLAKCLAFVFNKSEVDEEVLNRVRRVALDTARGRTLDIVRSIDARGEAGVQSKTISGEISLGMAECRKLLLFLKRIGVVEPFKLVVKGVVGGERWRLTERLQVLYNSVVKERSNG